MKKRGLFWILFLLTAAGLTSAAWRYRDEIRAKFDPPLLPLTLSGNVDDRQVNLSFMIPERIAEIAVEEGDAVRKGDVLGRLETVRIENRIAEAEAGVQGMKAAFDKAVNGYRKEEIAMAEAGVKIVEAQIHAAENEFKRNTELETTSAVSKQDIEKSEAHYNKLLAELELAQSNLNRMKAGSREEEIAAAGANLARSEALLRIERQNLADTALTAPCDGILRNRILEPGEMASPQTTALILAVVSPKWVRVYLSEPLLPKVKPGDKALISVDGLPDAALDGWVGAIAPNAEFTPKNVETKELRTSLVYEVRVYVNDPGHLLKLGAPATVTFPGITVRP